MMFIRLHSTLPVQDNFFLSAMIVEWFISPMFTYIFVAYLNLVNHYDNRLSNIKILLICFLFNFVVHSRSILTIYYTF